MATVAYTLQSLPHRPFKSLNTRLNKLLARESTTVDELTPAKFELAEKLSCTRTQLKNISRVPQHVISKNRATFKRIMKQTQTAIKVDVVQCQMEIADSECYRTCQEVNSQICTRPRDGCICV